MISYEINCIISVCVCLWHTFCNGYIQSGVDVFPTLVTKGQAFSVVAGDTLELPCVVHELGPYVVLWRRKNIVLTAHYLIVTRDPRYNLVNGFNLQIINVTSKDAGEYACQIADDKSRDVIHKVEVLDPRYNLVNGFNLQIINVTSKDAGEYACQLADDKSRDVIHKVEVLDPRYNLVNGFNLQIINVTSKDAGEYACQLADDKSRDVIHKVEVLVPPSIQSSSVSGQVTTRKGGNITLECKASGNPAPDVAWFLKKDGIAPDLPLKAGHSITLERVDRHHAGVYQCTADNGVGSPVNLDLQLNVLYPPEIEIDSPGYLKHDDCSVELTCKVHGNPTPNVAWYLDGALLKPFKRYHKYSKGNLYNLMIENIQGSDFGNFSCVSENSLGKTRKYIQLSEGFSEDGIEVPKRVKRTKKDVTDEKIKGNPSRAKFLSSPYSHTTDSYNLTWVVHSFAPIDEVRLLFRKLLINESFQQPGSWEEIQLKATSNESFPLQMSYNIEDLGMSSVFQALLQVRNRFGWSEESDLYQFYTRGPSEEIYELNVMDMELTISRTSKTAHFESFVLTWLICYVFLYRS